MSTPTVSIIVPNYNHSKYLEQRFESIFNQTYQDFEVIILDDCSTDNSRDIIERYRSNPKVSKIIYNEVNSGSPFKQWDKGIQLAIGDYLWIAESDDYCEPAFLQKMVSSLDRDRQCTLAFCRSVLIDSDGNHIGNHPIQNSHNEHFIINGRAFSKVYMKRENFVVNASSALFLKDAAVRISQDYTDYYGRGDIQFWIEIAFGGNVYYSSETMNYFRQHPSNTTDEVTSSTKVLFDMTKLFRFLYKKRIFSAIDYINARVYLIYQSKYAYICTDNEKIEIYRLNHGNTIIDFLVFIKHILHK